MILFQNRNSFVLLLHLLQIRIGITSFLFLSLNCLLQKMKKILLNGLFLKIGSSTFGIFDTFNDEPGREAHLSGKIAAALMEHADELLSKPPVIEKVELLAVKSA
jgi:hypothetical protein